MFFFRQIRHVEKTAENVTYDIDLIFFFFIKEITVEEYYTFSVYFIGTAGQYLQNVLTFY